MCKTHNTFCLYCNQHFLLTVGQDCMTLDSNKRTLQVWYGGAIMVGGRIQQKLRCMYGVHLLWHTCKRFIEKNIGWLRSSSKSVKKKKKLKACLKNMRVSFQYLVQQNCWILAGGNVTQTERVTVLISHLLLPTFADLSKSCWNYEVWSSNVKYV